jgi:ankyrin repeat protein
MDFAILCGSIEMHRPSKSALSHRAVVCAAVTCTLASLPPPAVASDVADAVMSRDAAAVSALIGSGADVNSPQLDGTTALHWAVNQDNLEIARLLIEAGADPSAANRTGTTPMRLATINGSASMIGLLLDAGVDPNAPLAEYGDTALMMAARTGLPEPIRLLLDRGAAINTAESWGGTTALIWAIAEHHSEAAALLIDSGADVNLVTKAVWARGRGAEGTAPEDLDSDAGPISYANGGLTPLHFAAREGQIESAKLLLAAGAQLDAIAADGKTSLNLAIYNGHYELAEHFVETGANVNLADAAGFPPLFWAVDRRNMEWNPGFPWVQTADPMPLIRKLLEAGDEPDPYVDATPVSRRNFGGSPRIKFATPLMRAAYSGDIDLVRLLVEYGADPLVRNSDNETPLLAASGYGWIDGYSQGRSNEKRLETIRYLVELGADVNWACNDGITPLMVAANFGDTDIIQYLVDAGADLAARDLGKKNDGVFGGSIEPLMPIDYAIGVGTFRPNNAILHMAEATELMTRMMAERGIVHTTSECTLRAFSCGDVDPQGATPADIAKARAIQVGNQVDGITGGLAADLEE